MDKEKLCLYLERSHPCLQPPAPHSQAICCMAAPPRTLLLTHSTAPKLKPVTPSHPLGRPRSKHWPVLPEPLECLGAGGRPAAGGRYLPLPATARCTQHRDFPIDFPTRRRQGSWWPSAPSPATSFQGRPGHVLDSCTGGHAPARLPGDMADASTGDIVQTSHCITVFRERPQLVWPYSQTPLVRGNWVTSQGSSSGFRIRQRKLN